MMLWLVIILFSTVSAIPPESAGGCWMKISTSARRMKTACEGHLARISSIEYCEIGKPDNQDLGGPYVNNSCMNERTMKMADPLRVIMSRSRETCRLLCDNENVQKLRASGDDDLADWAENKDPFESHTSPMDVAESEEATTRAVPSTSANMTTELERTRRETSIEDPEESEQTTSLPGSTVDLNIVTLRPLNSSTIDPEAREREIETETEGSKRNEEVEFDRNNSPLTGMSDVPQSTDSIDDDTISGDSLSAVLLKGFNLISAREMEAEVFFVTIYKNWRVMCSSNCKVTKTPFRFYSAEEATEDSREEIKRLMGKGSLTTKEAKKEYDNLDKWVEDYNSGVKNRRTEDLQDREYDSSMFTPKPPFDEEEGDLIEGIEEEEPDKPKKKSKRSIPEHLENQWEFVDENDRLVKIEKTKRKNQEPEGESVGKERAELKEERRKYTHGTIIFAKFEKNDIKQVNTVEIHKGKLVSRVQFTRDHLEKQCNNDEKYITRTELGINDGRMQGTDNYLVCRNGTVRYLRSGSMIGKVDCVMINTEGALVQCPKGGVGKKCRIESYEKNEGKGKLTINVEGSKTVQVSSRKSLFEMSCEGVCIKEVDLQDFVLLSCGSNSDYRTIDHPIVTGCHFSDYKLVNNVATRVCKEVSNAGLFWWFIVWFFLGIGITALVMFVLSVILLLIARCYSCAKVRSGYYGKYCACCSTIIEYECCLEAHSSCCNGICPFCREYQGNVNDLRRHCLDCSEREAEQLKAQNLVLKQSRVKSRIVSTSSFMMNWTFIRVVYIIVLIIIVILIVSTPARAEDHDEMKPQNRKIDEYYQKNTDTFRDENEHNRNWMDETGQRLESCGVRCYNDGIHCRCPRESKGKDLKTRGRFGYIKTKFQPEKKDWVMPKAGGYFPIKKTWSPVQSKAIMTMEINTQKTVGKKVVVTGQVLTEFPLEAGTGVLWNITTQGASESKIMSFSIYEASQHYQLVHKHWVVDRIVEDAKQVKCTGDDCHYCKDKPRDNCVTRHYAHDRNWKCNSDCITIGGGCTSCSLYAKIPDEDRIMTRLVEPKYMHTKMIICISVDIPNQMCKEVKDGDRFGLFNFEFQIGMLKGEIYKLPEKMLERYPTGNNRDLHVDTPENVYLSPDICVYPQCQHGILGDSVIYDLDPINYTSKMPSLKAIKTQFLGITMERECTTFRDPVCVYQNVVRSVKGQLYDLFNTSQRITDVGSVIFMDKEEVEFKPHGRMGHFTLMVKGNNVELNRKEETLEVNHFKVSKCRGCRSCGSGFYCEVSISIKTPKEHVIHLESNDDLVSLDPHGLKAEQTVKTFNVSLFTVAKIEKVELTVKETGTMSSCTDVILDEPKVKLNPPGYTAVKDTQDAEPDNTGNGFNGFVNGIWKGVTGFFNAGWALLKWVFSSWWSIIIYLIFVLIFLILFLPAFRLVLVNRVLRCKPGEKKVLTMREMNEKLAEWKSKAAVKAQDIKEDIKQAYRRNKKKYNPKASHQN